MVSGATTISWGTMFADVLDAPITELSVSNNVDAIEDFGNARTLDTRSISMTKDSVDKCIPYLPLSSSRICFVLLDFQSRQEQLHATCRTGLH